MNSSAPPFSRILPGFNSKYQIYQKFWQKFSNWRSYKWGTGQTLNFPLNKPYEDFLSQNQDYHKDKNSNFLLLIKALFLLGVVFKLRQIKTEALLYLQCKVAQLVDLTVKVLKLLVYCEEEEQTTLFFSKFSLTFLLKSLFLLSK